MLQRPLLDQKNALMGWIGAIDSAKMTQLPLYVNATFLKRSIMLLYQIWTYSPLM
jgi:hypothetical protein